MLKKLFLFSCIVASLKAHENVVITNGSKAYMSKIAAIDNYLDANNMPIGMIASDSYCMSLDNLEEKIRLHMRNHMGRADSNAVTQASVIATAILRIIMKNHTVYFSSERTDRTSTHDEKVLTDYLKADRNPAPAKPPRRKACRSSRLPRSSRNTQQQEAEQIIDNPFGPFVAATAVVTTM